MGAEKATGRWWYPSPSRARTYSLVSWLTVPGFPPTTRVSFGVLARSDVVCVLVGEK